MGSHTVTPRWGARGKREELHLSVIPCVLDPKCVRTCSSKLQGPVVKTQDFCELGYVGLAAGNQPWWEYCHHRDEQTLQIKLCCWLLNIHQHATGLLGAAQSRGLLIPPRAGFRGWASHHGRCEDVWAGPRHICSQCTRVRVGVSVAARWGAFMSFTFKTRPRF